MKNRSSSSLVLQIERCTFIVLIVSLAYLLITEYTQFRRKYYFKWWDVVEMKHTAKLCDPQPVFRNLWGLKISCDDKAVGKYLASRMYKQKRVTIMPAQTLYYRLFPNTSSSEKYLTVIWNDFSNSRRALEAVNHLARLNNAGRCQSLKEYGFVLFKTSSATIEGSRLNFSINRDIPLAQEEIEKIVSTRFQTCFHRYILKTDQQEEVVIIVGGASTHIE